MIHVTLQTRPLRFSNQATEVGNRPVPKGPARGKLAAIGLSATLPRRFGLLVPQQVHIADQCELLVRGFARVGIIAFVDEATGFQYSRTKFALARILEAFVAKELQPWVKTFPDEYYAQLFRLRGLDYRSDSVKRPQYFGTLTNDIVYKRLAPGVLTELKSHSEK